MSQKQCGRVLFFETHPIQYRAPVFQRLQQLRPDRFEVIYASDHSVRGGFDPEFGAAVTWDEPLMSGYRNRVLGNDGAHGVIGWRGLTARGVDRLIGTGRPAAVVLHSLASAFTAAAYWGALRRRVPIWYRSDTNERASRKTRGRLKAIARAAIYRVVYAGLTRALWVGELNRDHYRTFGVGDDRLARVPHCTVDRLGDRPEDELTRRRAARRAGLGVADDAPLVGFFGKLLPAKGPDTLLDALQSLAGTGPVHAVFVGAGVEGPALQARVAASPALSERVTFAGFVNQSAIDDYYLATDIMVLPSHTETWGLVVNEALIAGCAVVITDETGCAADFAGLERVRVVPIRDAPALAAAIADLAQFPRSTNWARAPIARYSVDAAAQAIAAQMDAVLADA